MPKRRKNPELSVAKRRATRDARTIENERQNDPEWREWGPYLSERQWGTLREDKSKDGNCWEYLPHHEATFRTYEWGEDGLLGICSKHAELCMALSLWNTQDPFLKERLFGLTGPQGNHGEDVKEYYSYVDSTPSHSYMRALYKYPQTLFPYEKLLNENLKRGLEDPEYELLDTGSFDDNKYFDVVAEYAKASSQDVLCRFSVYNRSDSEADIHVLPTLWFRNTWFENDTTRPVIQGQKGKSNGRIRTITAKHPTLENETNVNKLLAGEEKQAEVTPGFYKDAFHEVVVKANGDAINPNMEGTKCAGHYKISLPPNSHATIKCRLYAVKQKPAHAFGKNFDNIFNMRIQEANDFYNEVIPETFGEDETRIARRAYAGLCWTKQYFKYDGAKWWNDRRFVNSSWTHMDNHDIISMPDKWEFPWYATWDLAFHMVPFSDIDPNFAQDQMLLFLSDRYMHPNGQLPAYEFNFSDVNPPVHAWACAHIYHKTHDLSFLKKCFHKLTINFSWWVNTKSPLNNHLFAGGFLGMDNISCIERSNPPPGCVLQQADGTAWMAFYALSMLDIALELALNDATYEDMAIKYFQHFILIAEAAQALWCPEDKFFYDHMLDDKGVDTTLRVRSLVGLSMLFGCRMLSMIKFGKLQDFSTTVSNNMLKHPGIVLASERNADEVLLSAINPDQLKPILSRLLDEDEFLSQYGIRALSKYHDKEPLSVEVGEKKYSVSYTPGESNSDMFGGNSNWRGPIWICMNFLLLESLDRIYEFHGKSYKVDLPTSSHKSVCLKQVAQEIRKRIKSIFMPDKNGHRPCNGLNSVFDDDPNWRDILHFHEYFHGDTGRGCGASHQTGWTALITNIMNDLHTGS